MNIDIPTVIVIFYLYLLVKWELVRRPGLYLVGIASILLTILMNFFTLGRVEALVSYVHPILCWLLQIASLALAVGAVYRGQLPASVQKAVDQVNQAPK